MALLASKCYVSIAIHSSRIVVMATVQISARVDATLKIALERYCRSRGIVMNHFIQEALLDRLEELEDTEDLKQIRHEPTRPMTEVLKDLKLDGTL